MRFFGIVFFTAVFCGSGKEGSSTLLYLNFSLFILSLVYLFRAKWIPAIKSWEMALAENLRVNVDKLQSALELKKSIETDLAKIDSTIEKIRNEAHALGRLRKDAILEDLKTRILEKEAYRERLLFELKQLKKNKIRDKARKIFKEMATKDLSSINIDDQIKFVEREATL